MDKKGAKCMKNYTTANILDLLETVEKKVFAVYNNRKIRDLKEKL